MALEDEKHKLIYGELVNTLGQGNVSHDIAVMQTYSRDCFTIGTLLVRRPEFVTCQEYIGYPNDSRAG